MTWRDLLYPERVVAASFKLFLVILAILLIGDWATRTLSTAQLSSGDELLFLMALLVLSPIAYVIRERRRRRRPRPLPRRGAERQPVLPHHGG